MAVCNLFKELTNPSGNFLMFSQYVEDITRNITEGDNWKVIPTGFVALDIDYSKIDRKFVLNYDTTNNVFNEDLNTGIPKYFQNYFENACAYGRAKTDWTDWQSTSNVNNLESFSEDIENGNIVNKKLINVWNPRLSRNLFWNSMFKGKFLTIAKYPNTDNNDITYIPEVKYFGEIDMHSYNTHKGMGYGEIYCYIPSDAKRKYCKVINDEIEAIDIKNIFNSTKWETNNNEYLEGYSNKEDYKIENYSKDYSFASNFEMTFDETTNTLLDSDLENRYNINTIVVLYSIYTKVQLNGNYEWTPMHTNIPMGMYIMGIFDSITSKTTSNCALKHVTTSYNTGTSYGLRICNRFTVSPNEGSIRGGAAFNTDIIEDTNNDYTNMCHLMTSMNENLSLMLENTKTTLRLAEQYKELESILSNQQHNVPYIKNINGVDYWFVNGKMLSKVDKATSESGKLSTELIEQYINELKDGNANYWQLIEDDNGVHFVPYDAEELAKQLGVDLENDYDAEQTIGMFDLANE